jgi:glutamate-ammonia-ligase adenylyltransferase
MSAEDRAAAVARASRTLGAFLAGDEGARAVLEERSLPTAADYAEQIGAAWDEGGAPELRREKRRRLLQVAAWDLCAQAPLERVGAALADLADACLETTLQACGAPPGLAVIALGKLGGAELNYVSDIDIVFVTDDDAAASTVAAERTLALLGGFAPEGRAYLIDTSLRPEGRSGALVRTLEGALEYHRRWAQPWEHQALIKARAAAGDRDVGARFVEETRALVFPPEVTPERVAAIRKMKARVEEHAARGYQRGRVSATEDVKLGPGGIRDIEFSVQLFQLVHGGSDPSVRAGNTLAALKALTELGYIAEDDGAGLAVAYRWLRTVEHRLQLWRERRVRVLPQDDEGRSRLARAMRLEGSHLRSPAQRFDSTHRAVLADVRGRFEKLFYRPLIETFADAASLRLSPEALRERLRVLGFRDAERAARTLGDLVGGTSRRAKLLRVLSPAMLRFLSTAPAPDDGLLAFLRLAESLGTRLDVLGALRDNPPGLALLGRVLGSGRVLGELLRHVPEEIASVAHPDGPAAPKPRARLVGDALASLEWREPQDRLDGLRRFKRRELVRVALADLGGRADVVGVGAALADLADACLEAALDGAELPLAVVGMGKLGGRELNYPSDIDVLLVHDGDPAAADALAEELVRAIGEVTPEGQAFRIDLGLRPEGKAGALVRSLDASLEYYERWGRPWERLALTKARPSAGDRGLARRFVEGVRRYAHPDRVEDSWLREIRHLKARMERERVPAGVDARRHMKLGPGGMSDIEFGAGLLALAHGADIEGLRASGTLEVLAAARGAGLVSDEDERRLREAYVFLARLRNRLYLLAGRAVDVLPDKPETLEAAGIAMGFVEQPRQELEETFLRLTRRARRVAEPLIFA